MIRSELHFVYEVYDSVQELTNDDAALLHEAKKATELAYAPYSDFRVGAVAKLTNGEVVRGFNQENASFPAGLCAERVLLSAASSLYPGILINTIAISYDSGGRAGDHPISPCGICRQSLQEYEQRSGQSIRLILGGMEGYVYIISAASLLLPLAFTSGELNDRINNE